jgi:uncharacterized protein YoxC
MLIAIFVAICLFGVGVLNNLSNINTNIRELHKTLKVFCQIMSKD